MNLRPSAFQSFTILPNVETGSKGKVLLLSESLHLAQWAPSVWGWRGIFLKCVNMEAWLPPPTAPVPMESFALNGRALTGFGGNHLWASEEEPWMDPFVHRSGLWLQTWGCHSGQGSLGLCASFPICPPLTRRTTGEPLPGRAQERAREGTEPVVPVLQVSLT